jgi:hypothetical protein
MALPVSVPYAFANATTTQNLSYLDSNFNALVNGLNGLANGASQISISSISATGTANTTTYLRGDGSWSTVSGGGGSGSIIKLAVRTTIQTNLASTYTWYKLTYNAVDYDPDNVYSTVNSRYTAPSSGVYVIICSTNCRLATAGDYYDVSVYKNGTILSGVFQGCAAESNAAQATAVVVYSATLAANDYIELWGKAESSSASRSANYYTGATGWEIWKVS